MPTSFLRYDDGAMWAVRAKGGLTEAEWREARARVHDARQLILEEWRSGRQGWLGVPEAREDVRQVLACRDRFKKYTTYLVIGIGGSDLGARAAYAALRETAKGGMQLRFLGNTDPDEISTMLASLDFRRTIVNVISKSGDTVEPMTVFFSVREVMENILGKKKAAAQIVVTTDAASGSLHELAVKEGYALLPVPPTIGGRFSVLTPVGLFPLACAGIDIKKMLRGAAWTRDRCVQQEAGENDAVRYGALHALLLEKRDRRIHVCMPYAARLELFGKWYRQLWAESLGKRLDNDGQEVYRGPTPIAALGAPDQHSQMQLYMEGPEDKVVSFIELERFDHNLRVPRALREIAPLAHTAGKTFSQLIHAERQATADALTSVGRPHGTIVLPRLTPESLGALFVFYEIAVAVAGHILEVNPYDQPGVEAGKRRMREHLEEKV